MCFSLPRLRLNAESSASSGTRSLFRENEVRLDVCALSASSEAAESTLDDSDGSSFGLARVGRTSMAGVVARCGCASQQNVSRFHSRQLRFSNLFPSSIDSAHLENTESWSQKARIHACRGEARTHPHSKKTLHIPRVNLVHLRGVHCEDGRG